MDHLPPHVTEAAPEPASAGHATAPVGAESNADCHKTAINPASISATGSSISHRELAGFRDNFAISGSPLFSPNAQNCNITNGNKDSDDAPATERLAAGPRCIGAHRSEGRNNPDTAEAPACHSGIIGGDAPRGHAAGAPPSPEAVTTLRASPLLELAAVASPADAQIIFNGIRLGMMPAYGEAIDGDPVGAHWRRFRAACARAEMALHVGNERMLSYLRARASQADNEASFAEAALARMDAA